MRVRVVTYAPDVLTRRVEERIRQRFAAEASDIACDRYDGVLGPLRTWRDLSRGALPEIGVTPAIGMADALIVGAPLSGGRLALPMRTFLEHPNRIPPVIGVFATCARRFPAAGFDTEVERLSNSFGGPEALILSQWDMDAARDGTPRALAGWLDRLAPIVDIRVVSAMVPVLAA